MSQVSRGSRICYIEYRVASMLAILNWFIGQKENAAPYLFSLFTFYYAVRVTEVSYCSFGEFCTRN